MKIIRKDNFRVVVEPKSLGDYGSIRVSDSMFHHTPEEIEKAYKSRCDDIAAQIKRHCDDVRNAYVEFDTEELCSHCKLTWELDENGVPVCCEEAISEHEKATTTN